MLRLSVFTLALLLCACVDQDESHKRAPAERPASQQSAPAINLAPAAIPVQDEGLQPDAATLARADRILAYHNQVQSVLTRGSQAGAIMAGAQAYLSTWRLPRQLFKGKRNNVPAPPKGVFSDAEADAITAAMKDMDKALAGMLGHYTELEKYVADPAIRDDGKLGKELVRNIVSGHAQYLKARESWLTIVEKAAQQAETALLYGHPLKRQILAAQGMFAQLREVGNLVASGDPEKELLEACAQNIKNLLASAASPPFAAKPSLERYYRNFLKQVQIYVQILERGIKEGFHAVQKRELNAAAEASRRMYNRFASNVNES